MLGPRLTVHLLVFEASKLTSRLAADVRGHLELPQLPREWRVYDQEMRELHAEREQLRGRGIELQDPLSRRGEATRQPPIE